MEILRGIFLFLVIILLGIFVLKAASWSRKRNKQLQSAGEDSEDEIIKKYQKDGDAKTAFINIHASTVPKKYEIIGKVLAIAIILFITMFFLTLAYKGI